jgi:prepilin-type N-terminal cleavage/methylation domain-containing protein
MKPRSTGRSGHGVNSQRGFNLVEMMVSIGLLSLVVTLAGSALFQALGSQRWWQADAMATRDLRHAMSLYGRDAAKAETVDLADAGGPVSSLIITWPDSTGSLHTTTFAMSGDTLTRDVDGAAMILARNVTSVEFNRSGKTLQLELTVSTADGTRSQSLQVYAGRLP